MYNENQNQNQIEQPLLPIHNNVGNRNDNAAQVIFAANEIELMNIAANLQEGQGCCGTMVECFGAMVECLGAAGQACGQACAALATGILG